MTDLETIAEATSAAYRAAAGGPESAWRGAIQQSFCTGDNCGNPIRWVVTVGDRRMPLDPDPAPDGNVIRVDHDGQVRARVLTGDELPAQVEAWIPHHRTCPAASDFRRRKAATTPKCRACDQPLDRVWATAGHAHHVGCAPPAEFRDHVDQHRPAAAGTVEQGQEAIPL